MKGNEKKDIKRREERIHTAPSPAPPLVAMDVVIGSNSPFRRVVEDVSPPAITH